MPDKVFFDTNLLVYLYTSDEINKSQLVIKLLEDEQEFIISVQVLNEFINVAHKKRKIDFSQINLAIEEITEIFIVSNISISTIQFALKMVNRYKYSYYDCLIIASALENNCTRLYSEDMHAGQKIDGLEIINPFK